MSRVIQGSVPRPRESNAEISEELDRIILKALSPEPSGRYSTADELRVDLDRFRFQAFGSVTAVELGTGVTRLFTDVRERTQELIGAQLGASSPEGHEGPASEGRSLSWRGTNTSVTRQSYEAPPRALRRGWGWAAVGIIVGLSLMISARGRGVWREFSSDQPERAGAAAERVANVPPEAEPALNTATIRVTAFPETASIALGEEVAGSNPHTWSIPTDGTKKMLTVAAPGFVTQRQSLIASKDLEVVIHLQAASPASLGPAKGQPTPSAEPVFPRAVTRPESSTALPDCSPPYVIDERGIKRFKLRCMQ